MALQGNVVDLLIAVVIGAVFNEIVIFFVDNIMMPLAGVLMKGVDVVGLMWKVGATEVTYGIVYTIDSQFIFYSINPFFRFILRKRQEEEKPEADPKEELLIEIRDLLKEQQGKS